MSTYEILWRLTDAVRLWGALAGIIGLASILAPHHGQPSVVPPWSHPITQAGMCAFLVIAGLTLPITSHSEFLDPDDLLFAVLMLAAWYCIAVAAWAALVRHSIWIVAMRAASWLTLGGAMLASFLVPFA